MAERINAQSIGFPPRKSLLILFSMISTLFVFSWFFVLRSASSPNFIENSLLPSSSPRLFVIAVDNNNSDSRDPNEAESSVTNRAILSNGDEESSQDSSSVNCKYEGIAKPLKVFMYDMSPEFHFGLLGWNAPGKSVWPDIRTSIPRYAGGMNLQHSIEYWLTLDLLLSEHSDSSRGRTAIRVRNSSEADVVFVPFFSSVSYNRFSRVKPPSKTSTNKILQAKLVTFLTAQKEWKRSGGRDHVIMAHHPNSMLDARTKLWPAMFILADFGRYPPTVANVDKDVIAPYKHVIRNFIQDSSSYDSRPTLVYFQGAIYRKDGDGLRKATRGMQSSKFCLNIAGDTPSSNRLFDAIVSHCIPVIISDNIELPYEDVLDYSEFCVFVRASDAVKDKFLLNLIRGIGKDEWTRMWRRLKEVEQFFEYQFPSKPNDAVQMIWQAVARKVPAITMKINKSMRHSRSNVRREGGTKSIPSPRNFW
ncbi:Exostosin, GT47 domain [Dillenia turbinata]|uniref:Exostosin, GT47 domain n=1 Tax=Dillenia turbinata TaxID=194707 RepID=A0AAN8W3B5_9MAGN